MNRIRQERAQGFGSSFLSALVVTSYRLRGLLIAVLTLGAIGCAGDKEPAECTIQNVFPDLDGDGWGDDALADVACELAAGQVTRGGDCDDDDETVNPDAVEDCDGVDQDCNGLRDDDPTPPLYEDADGDGFGDPLKPLPNCDAWGSAEPTDCDDADETVHPDGIETCNGLDDDCDLLIDDADPSVAPRQWYADADGDGVGTGTPQGAGCDPPGPNLASVPGDCDDEDASRYPGAPELCNGSDDDCDLALEGPDAWAVPGASYRIPITLTPPIDTDADGPLSFDVDFRATLDALGDVATFDPLTLRAAAHDCGGPLGSVELPAAFLDSVVSLFVAGPHDDVEGNESGAVVVLWDPDGDASSREPWPTALTFGLYFQGTPDPSAFQSDLIATNDRLEAGGMVAAFDLTAGVVESLTVAASPVLASQTIPASGNGVRTPNGGLSSQDDTAPSVVLDAGTVTAAVRSDGHLENPSGGFDTRWDFRVFAGRPELWVTPRFVTTEPTDVLGVPDRTSVMRPWQSGNTLVGATCNVDPANLWADTADGSFGVTWAWVAPPLYVTWSSCADVDTWTAANDFRDIPGPKDPDPTTGTISTNTAWVDGPVLVVLPYAGPAGTADAVRDARIDGVAATLGVAERP